VYILTIYCIFRVYTIYITEKKMYYTQNIVEAKMGLCTRMYKMRIACSMQQSPENWLSLCSKLLLHYSNDNNTSV